VERSWSKPKRTHQSVQTQEGAACVQRAESNSATRTASGELRRGSWRAGEARKPPRCAWSGTKLGGGCRKGCICIGRVAVVVGKLACCCRHGEWVGG
jgi:hypothetical protein